MKEILASTCYLTLCLRRITNRGLIGIFVRFLLTHTFDDVCILDVLVSRLSSQTELRLATLQLFVALVDLNCEDVMLALTMKHLLPCSHVMLSQRTNTLQENDTDCLWAAKLLSLVPMACSSRSFRKPHNLNSDRGGEVRESDGQSSSRVRSWSKTSDKSDDSGENRYGQLAFIVEENDGPAEQMALKERRLSSVDCTRLRRYLNDNNVAVRRCVDATSNWRYLYNGQSPSTMETPSQSNGNGSLDHNAQTMEMTSDEMHRKGSYEMADLVPPDVTDIYAYCMEQLTSCLSEMNLASPGQSSGYESFNFQSRPHDFLLEDHSYFSKDVQESLEFWSMMRDDEDDDGNLNMKPSPKEDSASHQRDEECDASVPSVGLFLEILVRSVDGWLNNSVQVNTALAALISRLASYPHPLLRSFLLNPYLVLQPSIPCLSVSIATLKQRIDSALNVNENSASLVDEARSKLISMLVAPAAAAAANQKASAANQSVVKRSSSFFSVIYSSLSRKASEQSERDAISLSAVASNHRGGRRVEKTSVGQVSDPIGSHVSLCAVLLEEWLHELAAMCMEHAVYFTPFPNPIAQFSK